MNAGETFLKCPCSHCGGNIEFEAEHEGTETQCPHCGKTTVLRANAQPPPVIPPAAPLEPPPPHMRICRDCKHQVSRSAVSCPQCGAVFKKPRSVFSIVVSVIVSLLVIFVVIPIALMV